MKILVVGGTGYVGGYTALYMHDKGHEVTIMSRSRPRGTSRLNDLPYVRGDYVNEDFNDGRLEGYDGLMFCSGTDLGNYPGEEVISKEAFFDQCNVIGIPRFFEAARAAGIKRTAYMSSYYPMVNPDSEDPYVRSRLLGDRGARALSGPDFNVCSLGLPWILGYVPGLPLAHWTALAHYAAGRLPAWEEFAPAGEANYMTCESVAQAMEGGLLRGESGKDYLIGDANLTWKEFFELWFKAAGRPRQLEVRDQEHPLIPGEVLRYVEPGMAHYQPPEDETRLLGYRQGQAIPMIEESFHYYVEQPLPGA